MTVVEVGARDGLQNERRSVPAAEKIAFIDLLSRSGLRCIEVTSFVSPKAIPQLADAQEVFAGITKVPGVRYPVLVPNAKGYERARACGANAIAVFTAASEAFTKRNINMSVEESIAVFSAVVERAKRDGVWVRGYVSTAFGSPFGDAVTPEMVRDVCVRLFALGCDEISVGDTIGVGVPTQVQAMVPLLAREIPLEQLAFHFHDTRGTALANIYAALQAGVAIFDASAGGLGGCPYAPGATGNVGTEDVLYMLERMGVDTGVDVDAVRAASRAIRSSIDHELTSKAFQAMEAAQARETASR